MDFELKDIRSIDTHRDVWTDKPLSDRGLFILSRAPWTLSHFTYAGRCAVWTRIYPILLAIIEHTRDERLTREAAQRESRRQTIVSTIYMSLWSMQPPQNLVFYPREDELPEIDGLGELLDPTTDYLPNVAFHNAVAGLFANDKISWSLHVWSERRKAAILSNLPVSLAPCPTFSVPPELNLAKNVFYAPLHGTQYQSLYGAEAFAFRPRSTPRGQLPQFNQDVQRIVLTMMAMLALDPETTTTWDLDELKPLFWCQDCAQCTAIDVREWRSHVRTLFCRNPYTYLIGRNCAIAVGPCYNQNHGRRVRLPQAS